MNHLFAVLVSATLVGASVGCERDPLGVACPAAAVGDLVISEINAVGSSVDDKEQWVELFNTTEGDLMLAGATLRLRTLNGTRDDRIVVRSRDLRVPARSYVVLGNGVDGGPAQPSYVDYGYQVDFTGKLPEPGALDLLGCDGELFDRVIVRDFPTAASLAFDGALEPDAAVNDEANPSDPNSPWCGDGLASGDAIGTPGAANRPCSEGAVR